MTVTEPGAEADITGLPRDELLDWLADMLLIRRFEEVADGLTLRGKVPGGMHPAIGQEAVAVGTVRALRAADIITGTHRSHHHALAKGLPADAVLAELYGKATGVVGGRGGSMHLADFDRGYFGGNGIVGAGLGIAMGAALASSMRGVDQVSVGFFGDGGANIGRVWEFVNLAAVWKLPLIAICENNLYAVETPSRQVTGGESIATRAAGFGLPAAQVDGQDVIAVHRVVTEAAERARTGGGPTFLEALTYRYKGHNTGEVIRYRTEDEVESWRSSRDPIKRFSYALEANGMFSPEDSERLTSTAQQQVDAAVRFAEESPWPDPSTAAANVSAWSSLNGSAR